LPAEIDNGWLLVALLAKYRHCRLLPFRFPTPTAPWLTLFLRNLHTNVLAFAEIFFY